MKYIFLFVAASCVGMLMACGGNAAAPGKPAVQIIAPAYGSTFTEGETVGVQAVATDANGVVRMELYVDGQLANTKLAPVPQGEKQFNVVHEWLATARGAHTLTVRAFNAANVSGEASLPIAVNPPVVLAPTVAPVANTATPQLLVFTATPPPATPTVFQTLPPPTPVPPTPLEPTLAPTTAPPLVFLPPFDGGMNMAVDWSDEGLFIQVNANDTRAGNDDGDGIAYVEFLVQDLQGNVLATHRENTAPYCYFGDKNGECLRPVQGDATFKWSDTQPIKAGWYFMRAVAHTPDKRIQVAERPLRITFPPNSFEDLFVNLIEPNNFNLDRELVFEADVSGNGAASGIDRVEMFVVQYDGKIVNTRVERSPRYCGFGGGDNNQPCPAYRFAEHDLKWPDGAPVFSTQYLVRAVAYARDGNLVAGSAVFQIDHVK